MAIVGLLGRRIVSPEVQPPVVCRDGTTGGHIVFRGEPYDLSGRRFDRCGQPPCLGLAVSSCRGVPEEGRIVKRSVHQAYARIVAAGAKL